MKLVTYSAVSVAAVGIVTFNAWNQHQQFYSAAIHLSKSNVSLTVLLNFYILCNIWLGKVLMWIFFGQLRLIESEHLYERGWFAVSETALAMTIFRDEIGASFVIWFSSLLLVKCLHWVLGDRVDMMDQLSQLSPSNKPGRLILRTVSLFSLLYLVDVLSVLYSVYSYQSTGPNISMLFGFEFLLMFLSLCAVSGKFLILLYDAIGRKYLQRYYNQRLQQQQQQQFPQVQGQQPPYGDVINNNHLLDEDDDEDDDVWQEKSQAIFYVELAVDLWKLVAYFVFFSIITVHYGLPIHIIRDLYLTVKSFTTKVGDLIKFRRALHDMNHRLVDVQPSDIESNQDGIVCTICREEITLLDVLDPNDQRLQQLPNGMRRRRFNNNKTFKAKKLGCGHMFHFKCLRGWLERQQSCPTCRRSVFDGNNNQNNGPNNNHAPAQPVPQNHGEDYQRRNAPVQMPNIASNLQSPGTSPLQGGSNNSQRNARFESMFVVEADGTINYGRIKLRPIKDSSQNQRSSQLPADYADLEKKSEQELELLLQSSKQGLIERLKVMESAKLELDTTIEKTRHMLQILDTSSSSQIQSQSDQ
ncbi:hypothetical protein MIR68_012451 [Amoeboaphelidium protococcarum]|nr:hypothetical protein MIR68_012451 [Amoeboaphelidium protococcarum]